MKLKKKDIISLKKVEKKARQYTFYLLRVHGMYIELFIQGLLTLHLR